MVLEVSVTGTSSANEHTILMRRSAVAHAAAEPGILRFASFAELLDFRQASSCFPPIYPRRETPFAIDAVLHRLGQTCDLIFRPFARGNSFGARHKSDKHRRGKIHRVQF